MKDIRTILAPYQLDLKERYVQFVDLQWTYEINPLSTEFLYGFLYRRVTGVK